MFAQLRRRSRPSIVVLAFVAAVTGLGGVATAAASPPTSPSSVVASHLRINDHYGYLAVQLRIAADDPVQSFRVHSNISDEGPYGPWHRGSWVATSRIDVPAHEITCVGSNPGGDLDYTCHSTVPGATLPTGTYQLDLLARRIGALTTYSGQLWMTRPGQNEQFSDVFQVVSKAASADSTAESSRLDTGPGYGYLAVTITVAPRDPIYAVDVFLPETADQHHPWSVGADGGSFPNGIACAHFVIPWVLECARPDRSALPVGTFTLRVPLVRHGALVPVREPALNASLALDHGGDFALPEDAFRVE
jgi:hypothetical protein